MENLESKLTTTALGLCGESGEVADIVKKWKYHGHPLTHDTIEKLEKELGDIMWYLAIGCAALNTSMEWIAGANIKKLKDRYPEEFNTEQSLNRPNG